MNDSTEGGKYRILENVKGDVLQEGDEMWDWGTWNAIHPSFVGDEVYRIKTFRRPVAQEQTPDHTEGEFTHNIAPAMPEIRFASRSAAIDALVVNVFGAEPVYLDECRSVAEEPDPVEIVGVIDVDGRFNQSEMLAAEWDESYPDDAPHRDAVLVEKLP